MSIDLSQFIPTFLEESFEGIELMEAGLLTLEQGDDETINAIFRAAHSIKGGAGTFGFNHVTEFTHLVETLLDEMRDGRRTITKKDVEILLESVDCIRLLIEAIRDDCSYDESKIVAISILLESTLKDNANEALENNNLDIDPEQKGESNNAESTDNDNTAKLIHWSISFIPEHHIVQTGNDPLLLLNALRELGDVTVTADSTLIPSLLDFDATELYIFWNINLTSGANKEEIAEIFEWVEDECQLTITENEPEDNYVTDDSHVEDSLDATMVNEAKIYVEHEAAKATSVTPPQKPVVAERNAPSKPKVELSSIRVGVDKVDSLINLVGELVITQSMLSELGTDFDLTKVERLNSGLEQLLQNTKEIQESVMRIRMMPISFAFNRFPRLIHDLAKSTGKEIELVITGEQTELDKTVMEQISDPLVHLVRNAVDHGIEPVEIRIANAKPEKGTVTLNAFHQGGSIVIEIHDDGGGINKEAVFNKAVEKGLIEANTVLTDMQVYDLLFMPGFSTANEISDISGRGVGMDVVKRNIQSLGGQVKVSSELGKGSSFSVNLPLTLAILDGQLVRIGSEIYIIPLITIVESLQTRKELINRVSGDMVLYRLRENNVPVLPIYKLFNIPADSENIEHALLVVVEAEGHKVGLMVDDLLAQQQVVIKSLADNYQQVQGVSGATILGDGSVAMILDIPGLIKMAMNSSQHIQEQPLASEKVLN
jgi:two-component system chemotaxis sensor kinase CheA